MADRQEIPPIISNQEVNTLQDRAFIASTFEDAEKQINGGRVNMVMISYKDSQGEVTVPILDQPNHRPAIVSSEDVQATIVAKYGGMDAQFFQGRALTFGLIGTVEELLKKYQSMIGMVVWKDRRPVEGSLQWRTVVYKYITGLDIFIVEKGALEEGINRDKVLNRMNDGA